MEIREIRSIEELHTVEQLQKDVWNVDDLEVLPAIHMIAAREVGALIIGAFDGGGPLIHLGCAACRRCAIVPRSESIGRR